MAGSVASDMRRQTIQRCREDQTESLAAIAAIAVDRVPSRPATIHSSSVAGHPVPRRHDGRVRTWQLISPAFTPRAFRRPLRATPRRARPAARKERRFRFHDPAGTRGPCRGLHGASCARSHSTREVHHVMSIEAMGWNDGWNDKFVRCEVQGCEPGRVSGQDRGRYRVITADGERAAEVAGASATRPSGRAPIPRSVTGWRCAWASTTVRA